MTKHEGGVAVSSHWWLGIDSSFVVRHSAFFWNLGFAVVLFLLIWLAYRPSLAHVPRSDQWCFLLDTIDQHDFLDTFSHSYSYNRTRQVGPGDYHLFRPGLFALLSAEKAYFGNNFAAWQWVGIVLHFLAVYLALQIMLCVRRLWTAAQEYPQQPGWFREQFFLNMLPYVLALFFGLNFAVVESVIWSHINGYVLFLVFVLGALLLLLHYWAEPEAPAWRQALLLVGTWLLLLLSAFTYELGQFFAVVIGFALGLWQCRQGRFRRGVALFSLFGGLLVLYQVVNFLDQKMHPGDGPDLDLSTVVQQVPSTQSIRHAARYILYTTVQPFFPSCVTWSFSPPERVDIPEPMKAWDNYRKGGPLLITSYLMVGSGLLLAGRGFLHFLRQRGKATRLLLLLLPVSLLLLHLALTVFGRMNLRFWTNILSSNSYYTYVPLLALLIGLYIVWTSVPTSAGHRASRPVTSLYVALLAGLVILSLHSGEKVFAINAAIKKEWRSFHADTQWLAAFIRHHQHEPDFSFAFDRASYVEMEASHGIPLPVILFKQHLNNLDPKYLIAMRRNQRRAVRYHAGGRQVFPDLVRVGSPYNFFYYEGRYYGVLSWNGYCRPDRDDYVYLLADSSLEGAMRQMPAKLLQQAQDRYSGKFMPPDSPVALLTRGYKGFDLFQADGRIYAIPQDEGPLDSRRLLRNGYSRWYCGASADEVKAQIRAAAYGH